MKEEMLKFVSDLINCDDVNSIVFNSNDECANNRIIASVITVSKKTKQTKEVEEGF